MNIFIVPGLVLWCGVVVAITRPLFDPSHGRTPRIVVALRRDADWLLTALIAIGLPGSLGLAIWKIASLNQQVGRFGGVWTVAVVLATIGAAAFSAQAHLPGRPKKRTIVKMFDRNEREKLAVLMSEVPEDEPAEDYVPVRNRKRTVNLDDVLKRKGGAETDDENETELDESPDARLA